MCGIAGVATVPSRALIASAADVARMRDALAHRGPDGHGTLTLGNVVLAHRRLAVIDPSAAGDQPMTLAGRDGAPRWAITYNGELYNDADLRAALAQRGRCFRSACDTETLVASMAEALERRPRWGVREVTGALATLRGMYAFALHDAREHKLLLARDPLGVKPVVWAVVDGELIFASEPAALFEHPSIAPEPDLAGISAYLTTIRTSIGGRTMFRGVHALPPGHALIADLSGPGVRIDVFPHWASSRIRSFAGLRAGAVRAVRDVVADSIARHMRADVPVCAMLSGGLDSTITTAIARGTSTHLRTYCAGAVHDDPAADAASDPAFAREVASVLGAHHAELRLDRDRFAATWVGMVGRSGVPLSTPNETAIFTVAERLRADGCRVTISGEGADELFWGYDTAIDAAAVHASRAHGSRASRAMFHVEHGAWIPPAAKPGLLRPGVWAELESDFVLRESIESEFAAAADEAGDDGVAAHARAIRRINLTGLLGRLDSATMLASVEGRTPFADCEVARVAESLDPAWHFGGSGPVRTKLVLRDAFADVVPAAVLARPKASFPLPFQAWLGPVVGRARGSGFVRDLFAPGVAEAVTADPCRHWAIAWPMANLAIWAERWGW